MIDRIRARVLEAIDEVEASVGQVPVTSDQAVDLAVYCQQMQLLRKPLPMNTGAAVLAMAVLARRLNEAEARLELQAEEIATLRAQAGPVEF